MGRFLGCCINIVVITVHPLTDPSLLGRLVHYKVLIHAPDVQYNASHDTRQTTLGTGFGLSIGLNADHGRQVRPWKHAYTLATKDHSRLSQVPDVVSLCMNLRFPNCVELPVFVGR